LQIKKLLAFGLFYNHMVLVNYVYILKRYTILHKIKSCSKLQDRYKGFKYIYKLSK